MEFNIASLKRLAEVPGIAGHEDAVRSIVVEEMRPLVNDLRVDALGNVIATKYGSGGLRVMLAAHMDEIGFLVSHIDDDGRIRLQPVGGFDARNLAAQRVLVHTLSGGSLRGVLHASRDPHPPGYLGEIRADRLTDLFVDLGLTPEATRQRVAIGEMVTMDRTLEEVGDTVVSKSLDDRVSLFIMLEILRSLSEHVAEIVMVATVQEEVGIRGATTAAFVVDPDIGVAVDIAPAGIPGGNPVEQITRLGGGPAITVMDGSFIADSRLAHRVRATAERHQIPHQLAILPFGGTDAGAIHLTQSGVPSTTISIPTRYAHTVNEMAHIDDITNTIMLVTRFLESAHEADVSLA